MHPQRGTTSVVFMLASPLLAALVVLAAQKLVSEPRIGSLLGLVIAVFLCVAFGWIGLATWVLRIDVELVGGQVVITRHRLRGAVERQSLRRAAITEVAIEVDDGTARVVLLVGDERHPLTRTSTSDDVSEKAAALRDFLGLAPADQPVRVLPG